MRRESDGAIGTWTLKFPADGYRIYEQKVAGETLRLEMRSRGTHYGVGEIKMKCFKLAGRMVNQFMAVVFMIALLLMQL
jgi:hypothetical protein